MVKDNADSWLKKGCELYREKKHEEAPDCYLNATAVLLHLKDLTGDGIPLPKFRSSASCVAVQ